MIKWKFIFLAVWLGVLAIEDARRKRVPVWMLAIGGFIVTMVSLYECEKGIREATEVLWSLLPGIVLLITALTTKKAGWADGLVVLMMGLLVSYRECTISVVFSLLVMSIVALLLLVFHKVKKDSSLPYIPFLWAGYLAQVLINYAN